MTHPKSDFLKFIATETKLSPFMREILPIIPAGAKLSEESHLKADNLGKIPGKFAHGPKVWFGFVKWLEHYTNPFDLEKWQAWQEPDQADTAIAIGMRLGEKLVAIDIDENDEGRASYIELIARLVLGAPLCVRRREGSARRVLLYLVKPKTYPITKGRVAWSINGGEVSAVEVLGLGQHVVIEGPHAKGMMQYWLDGRGLTDIDKMSAGEKKLLGWLTVEDIYRFIKQVTEWVKSQEADGWTLHSLGSSKAREEPLETQEIASPVSDLRASEDELPTLVEAMKAISLDDPQIDYDHFILLQRALCAATGCDLEFLHEVVWPWVCESQTIARGNGPRTEEQGIEWLENIWRGFKTSAVGAQYIYSVARRSFGFVGGPQAKQEQLSDGDIARMFGEPIHAGESDGGEKGDNAGAVGGGTGAVSGVAAVAGPAIFRAELDPDNSDRPSRRAIQIDGDYLATAVDEVEVAMLEQGVGLFSRGDAIVRPGMARIRIRKGREIDGERIHNVEAAELREHMTKCARFVKWNAGSKQWMPNNAPEDVARAYLARRAGMCGLRPLSGIITAPTLRADGSIIDKPGFDEETGLLYRPDPNISWLPIPEAPTKDDAILALIGLKGLISDFPFVSPADLSVSLSAVLTAVARRPLPSAPLIAFSSPMAGTGKGKLVDIASIIATGREASADVQGRDEEEMGKRLVALLKTGDPVILIDNCTLPIEGDFLCAMLTREYVQPRILGTHDAPRLPTNAALFATGNNIVINADMVRRSLLCHIDANVERPELRKFDIDPVEEAKKNRGAYLRAALMVMRAYAVAGRPPQSDPLGSFEVWNHIRDALIWAGEVDPCATQKDMREVSPEHGELAALLGSWHAVLGAAELALKEAINKAANTEGGGALIDAIQVVAGSAAQDAVHHISMKKLGWYLRSHTNRIANGFQLIRAGTKVGQGIWQVKKLS